MSMVHDESILAIDGGTPTVTDPLPPMYPGGMRLDRREEESVLQVVRSRRLFRYYGPGDGESKVDELEQAFAQHVGAGYCLATSSGTAALTAALVGLGVGPGDEVIIPAYTFIATAAAVLAAGAVPVLAEVDESLQLDPNDTASKITERTAALLPVHMRGTPADMDRIGAIARRHGLAMVEDAAQAIGGSYHGQRVGTIGDAGAYSLQFNKIITCGEGGLLVTNDKPLYQRMLMYHDVNAAMRHQIPVEEQRLGVNLRLSELQGAVALVQLRKLETILADMRRHKAAVKEGIATAVEACGARYRQMNSADGDTGLALIFFMPAEARTDRVIGALRAEGVSANRLFSPDRVDHHVYYHWPSLLEKRTCTVPGPWNWHTGSIEYHKDMCPRTLGLLGRAVQLDISPDLTDRQVAQIVEATRKVLDSM